MYSRGGIGSATRWLQIQVDGGSENINRTVLAFFAVMIAKGWIKCVTIHRLVVGHTHAIIDQWFHSIRAMVMRMRLVTLFDALTCFKRAKVGHSVVWVHKYCDFDGWFAPHLVPHMHGIRKPLVIKIEANRDDPLLPPQWRWKQSSTDSVWLGAGLGEAIPDVQVLASIPAGQPTMITDEWMPNSDHIKCFRKAQRFVNNVEDSEWLDQIIAGGAAAFDIRRLSPTHFVGGEVGYEALVTCVNKSVEVRCIGDMLTDMWIPPTHRRQAAPQMQDFQSSVSPSERPAVHNTSVQRTHRVGIS
jgi:hypothetical protein